jgi:hypothetical protein
MRMTILARTMLGLAALVPLGEAGVLPISAASASADVATVCKQWNIAGTWTSAASNNFHVTFVFVQNGKKVHGVATIPPTEATITGYAKGTFTGTLKGSHVNFVVVWTRSTLDHIVHRGDYYGTVSKGAVVGLGKDLSVPGQAPASWTARGPTKCVKR